MTYLSSHVFGALFDAPYTNTVFSDDALIGYCLQVEVALATVQARLQVIPSDAADQIKQAASELQVDKTSLRLGTEKSSVPIIDLVTQLRHQVSDKAASYIHWGATSQDILDTALVLQIQAMLDHLEDLLQQIMLHLSQLADQHRHTSMAGRTHSQQALPIPFGLKVAGWLAPLLRHQERLTEMKSRLLVVQLGGGVGTLASLGAKGIAVQEAFATELGLEIPLTTWHTQRDTLAELAGWLSLLSGSLAKMAQDIILMAQTEVSELRESDDPSRGKSSTMPQKRNPIMSEIIITAARTNATLLSEMHHALIQEHERATHGWQMEWLTLPQMFAYTEIALNKSLNLSKNLVVDVEQMKANVTASNGLMLAEAINLALAPIIGRTAAKTLIKNAVPIALAENRHLVDVIQEQVEVDVDWKSLKDETNYWGASQTFINRILDKIS